MCGIFGCIGVEEAVDLTLEGLFCLQHRGQESAGVAVWGQKREEQAPTIHQQKELGYVGDLRKQLDSLKFPGQTAIGHVRYGTTGGTSLANAQPLVRKIHEVPITVAHNGDLVQIQGIKESLEKQGALFETTSDTEIILHLLARSQQQDVISAIIEILDQLSGAFSLLFLWQGHLIAAKDPWGVRPLAFGRLKSGYAFASEDCAFDHIGIEFIRNLKPGEVVVITPQLEVKSYSLSRKFPPAYCSFEYVYFARPDSRIFDQSVSEVRKRLAIQLAQELKQQNKVPEANIIVPVLDSGRTAGLTLSCTLGIPLDFGLNRNHYSGRNFITPGQDIREGEVDLKHNADRAVVGGKRVILVDDSIVRGTTTRRHVRKLKEAGAREVHVLIASPRIIAPCYYGIDTKRWQELIALSHSLEETCRKIEADSLYHISLEGFKKALGNSQNFCLACFSNNYPISLS